MSCVNSAPQAAEMELGKLMGQESLFTDGSIAASCRSPHTSTLGPALHIRSPSVCVESLVFGLHRVSHVEPAAEFSVDMDTAEYDTNTVLLNQIASIKFRIYKCSSEAFFSLASVALDIENTLRKEGHLVLYDSARRGLWHFQLLGKQGLETNSHSLDLTLRLCGLELSFAEEGLLDPTSLPRTRSHSQQAGLTPTSSIPGANTPDSSQHNAPALTSQDDQGTRTAAVSGIETKVASIPNRTVYGNFITALLLSISTTFCNRTGAIPLDYQTLLLTSHDLYAQHCPVWATLKAYLTTAGALVISLTVSRCNGLFPAFVELTATDLIRPGVAVVAAPFGVMTSYQAPAACESGTASLAQTPNTQAMRSNAGPDTSDSLWKQACLKAVRLRGVMPSSVAECGWVKLSVPRHRLQDAKIEVKRLQASGSAVTILWPAPLCFYRKTGGIVSTNRVGEVLLSGHEESHDPLSNARVWFKSSADRKEKALKRKAERALASKEAFAADCRAPKVSTPSPGIARRPSTAAAGTIYPTPPDGIQYPNAVTLYVDGTVSSPKNPLAAVPTSDLEPVAYSASGTVDAFEVSRELSESKCQRNENNLLGEAEHIFRDMSSDIFGDHDITEADFNFFDEQPGDLDLDVVMGDVSIENYSSGATLKDEQYFTETANLAKVTALRDRDTAIFAKPELKHARSSQNDACNQRGGDGRSTCTKRETSPFDPHTVFKRVCSSLANRGQDSKLKQSGSSRSARIFDSMSYDSSLPMINKKYEQGGQYDYRKTLNLEKAKLEQGILPQTDYLKRHAKQMKKVRDRHFNADMLMKSLVGLEAPMSRAGPVKADCSPFDDDNSSIGSKSDSSYTTDDAMSPPRSGTKIMTMEDDAASQVTSLKDTEQTEEPDQQLSLELPRLFKPESPKVPLSLLFSDPEPLSPELSLNDDDMIQVAQILTEQAAIGSLEIAHGQEEATLFLATGIQRSMLAVDGRKAVQVLRELVFSLLKGSTAMDLGRFLDVADTPLLGQPARSQAQPIGGREVNAEPTRISKLYQMPSPHLEVRRSETRLSVLPSAVLFWESLGLAPSCGGKDVYAVCVYPGWDGMTDNVKTFLRCLKSVYETLKLGSFENMPQLGEARDGMLPFEVDRISTSSGSTLTGYGLGLAESMEKLLGALLKLEVTAANIVVYFVYSPRMPGSIVEACIAFQRLFESYRTRLASQREAAQNELVLQLMSCSLLSSPTAVVMAPAAELFKLCMETYDRCTLFGGPMPAPAIRLGQTPPRLLDFKLTVSPSASLMRENSCIHVAYAQSVDERWIATAWTDDQGNRQETASYCLGRKGRALSTTPKEVAHEIWESTVELMSSWNVHWRVVITKCGPLDQQDMDCWVELARKESRASVSMILMTVDTGPALQLIPPAVKLPPPSATLYTTPASTPQASMVSPEQSGTTAAPARDGNAGASTPGVDGTGEAEFDAVLCDVSDQTWAAVVGHRLNNSLSVTETQPALLSGYLIKRTGARTEDAPALMEVNLVHTDAAPRNYGPLFREMLAHFHGLGTLARVRGVVQREADVRPWHIAAVEKAVRVLYLLM